MKRVWSLIIVFGLLAAPVVAAVEVHGRAHVIDGDSLELGDEEVRLKGIDAPEGEQLCRRDGAAWACGEASAQALRERVRGRTVVCRGDERDDYGRLLAVCRIDGVNLNAAMVREGWALAFRYFSDEFVAQERSARAGERGIWSGEFVPPWDWRHGRRLGRPAGTSGSGGDRDCSDFRSWRAAQRFFERAGRDDPHRLDGDEDGTACESLKRREPRTGN